MSPGGGRIIVGVDGSKAAEAALEWAAEGARQRGATLEVVTVWEAPGAFYGGGAAATVVTPSAREPAEAHAREIAEHAVRRAESLGARAVPRTVEGQVSGVRPPRPLAARDRALADARA